jgi:hypothetical protein
MGMKLDYMLFSAPNIVDKIKWTCNDCGQPTYTDGKTRKDKCSCGSTNTCLSDPLIMGGLYCWVTAFREAGGKGVMKCTMARDELEKFDIIHVNVTPGHYSYVPQLREALGRNSDTKIVVNVDYATSLWGNTDPFILKKVLEEADMVFHVEKSGARRIGKVLGKDVPCIPHPVDVERIGKLRTQPSHPAVVTCHFHRYWGTWAPYYYATMKLRKEYNLRTMLVNVWGDTPIRVSLESYFDEIVGNTDYFQFMQKVMAPAFCNMDVTPDYTYGRGVVESAALGIPTIGSCTIEAQRKIWSGLMVGHEDDDLIEIHLRHLITDTEFAKEMSDQGIERCKFYSTRNSYERMVEALEGIKT